MPALPYAIPLRYDVVLRQHAFLFIISYLTFHEILFKGFENTSLLSNEDDSDFLWQLYV